MPALSVTILRSADEQLTLEGCQNAIEVGDNGMLLLQFAEAAAGLTTLDACMAADGDVCGTMTVIGADRATEYNCRFVARDGNDVTFQLVCLDD